MDKAAIEFDLVIHLFLLIMKDHQLLSLPNKDLHSSSSSPFGLSSPTVITQFFTKLSLDANGIKLNSHQSLLADNDGSYYLVGGKSP